LNIHNLFALSLVLDSLDKKLNNMQPVLLPILCHNSDTILFSELGVEYKFSDLEEVEFLFFNIDYACGNFKQGKEYTEIVCDGDAYVVNLTFDQFKQLFISWQK
jgi:hypothetical protein